MNAATLSDFRRIQFDMAMRYVRAVNALESVNAIDASLVRLRDESRERIAEQCAAWFEVVYSCPACDTQYYEYPLRGWCDNCNTKVGAA